MMYNSTAMIIRNFLYHKKTPLYWAEMVIGKLYASISIKRVFHLSLNRRSVEDTMGRACTSFPPGRRSDSHHCPSIGSYWVYLVITHQRTHEMANIPMFVQW